MFIEYSAPLEFTGSEGHGVKCLSLVFGPDCHINSINSSEFTKSQASEAKKDPSMYPRVYIPKAPASPPVPGSFPGTFGNT